MHKSPHGTLKQIWLYQKNNVDAFDHIWTHVCIRIYCLYVGGYFLQLEELESGQSEGEKCATDSDFIWEMLQRWGL